MQLWQENIKCVHVNVFIRNVLVFYWRRYEIPCHEIKIISMNADMIKNFAQKNSYEIEI